MDQQCLTTILCSVVRNHSCLHLILNRIDIYNNFVLVHFHPFRFFGIKVHLHFVICGEDAYQLIVRQLMRELMTFYFESCVSMIFSFFLSSCFVLPVLFSTVIICLGLCPKPTLLPLFYFFFSLSLSICILIHVSLLSHVYLTYITGDVFPSLTH